MRQRAGRLTLGIANDHLDNRDAQTPTLAAGLGVGLLGMLLLVSLEPEFSALLSSGLLGPRATLLLCSLGLLTLSLAVSRHWRQTVSRLARRTALLEQHLQRRRGKEQAVLQQSEEVLRTRTGELQKIQDELRASDERLARALQALRERTLRLHQAEDKLRETRRALRRQVGQRRLLLAGLNELSASAAREPTGEQMVELARAETSPSIPFEAALGAVNAAAWLGDETLDEREGWAAELDPGATRRGRHARVSAMRPTPVESTDEYDDEQAQGSVVSLRA